ncbi:hypothetical protein BgAZ_108770 [Babesia gibsoni]|uniref:Uncharacterized protein n=1 Tax=Babesia gibsoni TaxID=33632 RepID=A0AAD8UU10_BABGI|nr:hypothetical protein BgAZ_108770 [Babesia gibsoni]
MDNESPLINDYDDHNQGADQKSLRSVCFLSGCALCLVSVLNAINILSITRPTLYLLNAVQGLFGFTVMVVEGDEYSALAPYANVLDVYFKFLESALGRALFFLFVGLQCAVLTSLSVLYYPLAVVWVAVSGYILATKQRDGLPMYEE